MTGGVTGGKGGTVVYPKSAEEFINYIKACVGLLIGLLPFESRVTTSPANAVGNIINRNNSYDGNGGVSNKTCGISVIMHSHHVWVDHCFFTKQADSALDTKRGSS